MDEKSVKLPYQEEITSIKVGDVEEIVYNEEIVYDEAKDRILLRKIDMHLLPVMMLIYCFQFMDKSTLSLASVMGFRKDLNMVGDMYSWIGSSFYLGYIVFEFPAVRLLQRFPVAKTVSIFIIIWGAILALHAAASQYAGLVALRVLLGMLESSITPAFVIITGQYYRKQEMFVRTSIWFASNGIGIILGSGIAYGLVENMASYSIEAWKLVFIITGVLTIFLGIVCYIHIPDIATDAWWFTEEDKLRLVERIRDNQQGFGNKEFKWYQFREAMMDIKTWLFFVYSICSNVPNGGLTNFSSILLTENMGFTPAKALLMQMPQGAVEFVGCIGLALSTRFIKSKMAVACFGTGLTLMACCMLAFGNSIPVRYAGLTMGTFLPVGGICLLSNIGSNVAGHTKKVTVNAIFLVGYCIGNLVGPQTFIATQAPDYTTAVVCMVVFMILALLCLIGIWVSYYFDNKKKDAGMGSEETKRFMEIENHEFADFTDKENPLFRYLY